MTCWWLSDVLNTTKKFIIKKLRWCVSFSLAAGEAAGEAAGGFLEESWRIPGRSLTSQKDAVSLNNLRYNLQLGTTSFVQTSCAPASTFWIDHFGDFCQNFRLILANCNRCLPWVIKDSRWYKFTSYDSYHWPSSSPLRIARTCWGFKFITFHFTA